MDGRPDWDEYFLQIAHQVRKRSTCLRRQVGAILVKEKRILATGYNGAPKGLEHCVDTKDCIRESEDVPSGERFELCRAVHAEQNTVAQAAFYGVKVEGSTLYTTTFPCVTCAKILINAGVVEIVYHSGYPDELSQQMLEESGIVVREIEWSEKK
jgi:dCMP deaminase